MLGVPLIAWEESLFSMLGNRIGRFLKTDLQTKNKLRLDVGRFLIETSSTLSIDCVMMVSVEGEEAVVKLSEEPVKLDSVQVQQRVKQERYGESDNSTSSSGEKWADDHRLGLWEEEEDDGCRVFSSPPRNSNFSHSMGQPEMGVHDSQRMEGHKSVIPGDMRPPGEQCTKSPQLSTSTFEKRKNQKVKAFIQELNDNMGEPSHVQNQD